MGGYRVGDVEAQSGMRGDGGHGGFGMQSGTEGIGGAEHGGDTDQRGLRWPS